MAATRFLITGGAGQLARELQRRLPEAHAPTRRELSVTDPPGLLDAIARSQVALVFNCAAYNAVDTAEDEPELAQSVNAEGAQNVALACREAGVRMVHFSTNYVFDGTAAGPYYEDDEPSPLGVYGRSKLEGERRVLDALPGALVIRSSGLFGNGGSAVKGGSFPDRILARAAAGEKLKVVADQWLNPTYVGHLAEASIRVADQGLEGILHLVAADCCSYQEFAAEVLRVAGMEAVVEPLATVPASTRAARPANGCMGSRRVPALPPWSEGVREYWLQRAEMMSRP